MKYVELSDQEWNGLGATAGVAELIKRIRSLNDGRDIVDAGQGAELELKKDDPLYLALTEGGLALETGEYNTSVGGDIIASPGEIMSVREKIAAYMHDTYRIPATAENTFLIQALGRDGVGMEMEAMAYNPLQRIIQGKMSPGNIEIGMAREHWGTLSKLAEQKHLTVIPYDNRRENTAEAVFDAFFDRDLTRLAGITFVSPANPTSQVIDANHNRQIVERISEANLQKNVDIRLLYDFPYAFACSSAEDFRGRYTKTGIENVLYGVDNVDWSFVSSTSKMLSMAKTGQTILVVNPERARQVAETLANSGRGLGRVNSLSRNIAELVGGDRREILQAHIAGLRQKYARNDEMLESGFTGFMVSGDPHGMLRLMDIPVAGVFNKVVACRDGRERVLRNGNDVVTYLANEFGAAVVNSGVSGDKWHLRWAKRDLPGRFERAVTGVRAGLNVIMESPAVAVRHLPLRPVQAGEAAAAPPFAAVSPS